MYPCLCKIMKLSVHTLLLQSQLLLQPSGIRRKEWLQVLLIVIDALLGHGDFTHKITPVHHASFQWKSLSVSPSLLCGQWDSNKQHFPQGESFVSLPTDFAESLVPYFSPLLSAISQWRAPAFASVKSFNLLLPYLPVFQTVCHWSSSLSTNRTEMNEVHPSFPLSTVPWCHKGQSQP